MEIVTLDFSSGQSIYDAILTRDDLKKKVFLSHGKVFFFFTEVLQKNYIMAGNKPPTAKSFTLLTSNSSNFNNIIVFDYDIAQSLIIDH